MATCRAPQRPGTGRKCPANAGILLKSRRLSGTTDMPGWGARIRTWEWWIQKSTALPLGAIRSGSCVELLAAVAHRPAGLADFTARPPPHRSQVDCRLDRGEGRLGRIAVRCMRRGCRFPRVRPMPIHYWVLLSRRRVRKRRTSTCPLQSAARIVFALRSSGLGLI
jgi:hypothetical protein